MFSSNNTKVPKSYASPTNYRIPLQTKQNEPLGARGPPLVGEEVRKEVGKVGSW